MNAAGHPESLTPFPKGVSGNPGGRPRKRPVTDEYFQILGEKLPEVLRVQFNDKLGMEVLPPGSTWARANALRRAMDSLMETGHMASKEMREAIEGKAPIRLEIQGTERKEVTLEVIFRKTITSESSSE